MLECKFRRRRASSFLRVIWASALLSGVAGAAHADLAAGDSLGNGRVFLFDEKVEIYGNTWSGARVMNEGGQVDVHIRGEGKTVGFDGILSMNCESGGGSYWIVAGNFEQPLSPEDGTPEVVPEMVLPTARKVFCP